MRSSLLAFLLGAACWALGAPATRAGEEPPATVKAQRYRVVYAESGLDLAHGGGRWVDEVFLPEAGVVAMLVFDTEVLATEPGAAVEIRPRARLFAFRAEKPRNGLTGLGGAPSTIEETRIPADLAREIVALAELTERQQAETKRLGDATARRLGWKEIPPEDDTAR